MTGLKQKDIRQWMRKHPGHRSFTVLRHPLERAYHVFNSCILPADRPAFSTIRRVLMNRYALPIPKEGPGAEYDATSTGRRSLPSCDS